MKWTNKLEEMFRRKRDVENIVEPVKESAKPSIQPLPINFELRALIVTDGHGCLEYDDVPICDIHVCFLLGDLSLDDIAIVKEKVRNVPIYGVLGNHDSFELYDRTGIENIHGKVVEVNGVRIAGMQGSLRYKDSYFPFYTDEESVEIAEQLEAADILVSHDYPKNLHGSEDFAHSGLQGITYYCEKYNLPLNIHGHYHDNGYFVLENGTRSIECYKSKILEISPNGILII